MNRPEHEQGRGGLFAGLAGMVLAVALWKYGTPVILADSGNWLVVNGMQRVAEPSAPGWIEFIFASWPLVWAYWMVVGLVLSAVGVWRWYSSIPWWARLAPALWLLWQGLAAIFTVDWALTFLTLRHFASCAIWFYLGLFALARVRRPGVFLGFLVGAFSLVVVVGWYQHWVGLEETRRYFYELPNWREFPPSFLDKLGSDRIFSTLFYPNALAGGIILFLPLVLVCIWQFTGRWERQARVVLVCLAGLASLACLYWSRSKAGWLIMLAMGLIAFLRTDLRLKVKLVCVGVILAGGLAIFLVRHSQYLARGATSLTARLDYWRAAVRVVGRHPLLGTGPGTFMVNYRQMKQRRAEMTRLVHNDYLQQACDSGLPGFFFYAALTWGSLGMLYRKRSVRMNKLLFSVWLGLLGFCSQELVEFGLYIPALAWGEFLLFGWLWGLSDRGGANGAADGSGAVNW